ISSVSRAMRRREGGSFAPSVRMLCRRSASLIRITRRSRAIASSILRKLSASASWRLPKRILSSLVTPSTSSATVSPNSPASALRLSAVSSRVSCRIAAMMVSAVMAGRADGVAPTARSCSWVERGRPRVQAHRPPRCDACAVYSRPPSIVADLGQIVVHFGGGPFQRLAFGALAFGLVDLVDGGLVDAATGDLAQRQHGGLVIVGIDRRFGTL